MLHRGTCYQADGKAEGPKERPEGEVVLEGLARQPLRSVVIALAANSFGGGRSGGTEEG